MKDKHIKIFLMSILPLLFISCGGNKKDNGNGTVIQTTQKVYSENQPIVVDYQNMLGHNHDWIGIYPAGVANSWGNQVDWAWTEGKIEGQKEFNPLPYGHYEVRAFFNNSFKVEARYRFKVDIQYDPNQPTSLKLNKNIYAQNELIYVQYSNMQGNQTDKIALYPLNSNRAIDSKRTGGNVNGELSLGGLDVLADSTEEPGGLKVGEYEVKAFFNNSENVQTIARFSVAEQQINSTLYESATEVLSPNWVHISGPMGPYLHRGMVNLTSNWVNDTTNTSEYKLVFDEPNNTQKILELDAGGIRYQLHFYIGVILETLHGPRKMAWDPFFTHGNVKPFKKDQYLYYPLYVDIQLESERRQHVRVDIEKYLRLLEPNNKVLSISAFIASGGDLDEIKLSSH
jgi:hypothetical protein